MRAHNTALDALVECKGIYYALSEVLTPYSEYFASRALREQTRVSGLLLDRYVGDRKLTVVVTGKKPNKTNSSKFNHYVSSMLTLQK